MYRKGFSKPWLIATVVAVILVVGGLVAYVVNKGQAAVHFEDYDANSIIAAGDYNGNIAEHIEGNADAPVLIYEYANFQCNHCAAMHPLVTQAVENSDGKLAVVFRNFAWASFPNSKAAAAAAEAAGLQGYWQPYATALFAAQSEWSYSAGTERTALFEKYFTEVSNGEGDLEKFRHDLSSEAVSLKVQFDIGMGTQIGVAGTPSFFVEGQFIDMNEGGTLTLSNGKTITYEPFKSNEDFTALLQNIITAVTSE